MVLLCDEAQVEAWKSFWKKPIELQGDVAHVESRFGLIRDGVSVGTS
jgi:hypothetical protein